MSSSICPECGQSCHPVKEVTLRHHLLFPLSKEPLQERYHYCSNSTCHVAYFSTATVFHVDCLQSQHQIEANTICFCFGITQAVFEEYIDNDRSEAFFSDLDNLAYGSECHCKVKNPAGRGCLKVFKRLANVQ